VIVIELDPYLIRDPFAIRWYTILLFTGIGVGFFLLWKLARKYELDPSDSLFLALATVPGGLIGARLLHVIDYFDYYRANPGLIPRFWEGGFAQYGMIFGGIATALVLHAFWRKVPFIRLLDLVPAPVLVGLSIGRIGCITLGCCYGSATDLPWGFVFAHPDSFINIAAPELRGVPVHPAQVYEIVSFLALAGVLLCMYRHLQPIKGMSFLVFLVGHSVARFSITFLRGDYPELLVVAWLTQAQIIALAVLFISVPWLVILCIKAKRRNRVVFL